MWTRFGLEVFRCIVKTKTKCAIWCFVLTGCWFETSKAIELLLSMQSWTFCKEVFVSRQGLQTAVNKYLSTKILVPIPPEYMCTILRITSKLHVPIPWLDFIVI